MIKCESFDRESKPWPPYLTFLPAEILTLFLFNLSLCIYICLSLIPCSLSAGIDNDLCCDAAVRDGPACLTLPGALHPDNLCCGGWVQARDEAVLGRNHLWGERFREFKVFLNRFGSVVVFDKCASTSSVLSNRCQCISEKFHTSCIYDVSFSPPLHETKVSTALSQRLKYTARHFTKTDAHC